MGMTFKSPNVIFFFKVNVKQVVKVRIKTDVFIVLQFSELIPLNVRGKDPHDECHYVAAEQH